MAIDIEQLLMAKLGQEAESAEYALPAGAAIGTLAGVAVGTPVHLAGEGINRIKNRLADGRGLPRSDTKGLKSRLKPGHRMAGGLIGLILGGGLGETMRRQMITGSPTAEILTKIQTRPDELTEEDKVKLESALTDTYMQMGIL